MATIAGIAFEIDRSGPEPAFAQVYRAIRRRIVDGALKDGDRLPPSRGLAVDLGLSRSTINAAYDQLIAEGYVATRQGAGCFVRPIGEVELAADRAPAARQAAARPNPEDRTGPPPPPVFAPGVPDMRLFPYAQWARTVARVARAAPAALIATSDPFGDMALRQSISAHIAEWRGVHVPAERIVVTAGSGDALEICIRAFATPGDRVGLEDPGYPPLRNFVRSLGLAPTWLAVDAGGAELPGRVASPRMTVLTPSHQFPLGGAMSPERRSAHIAWAAAHDAWIVEDDYDSEFRYSGRPIPAMAGLDRGGRTIYVGGFSKVFSNSLRIGYLAAPEGMEDRVRQVLRGFGVKASIAPQRPLAAFIDSGEFYRHLRRMRRLYDERRRMLVDALREALGDLAAFTDHQAGMLIALNLPEGVDDRAIAAEAAARGLGPLALSAYYANDPVKPGLVLGFCAFEPAEIKAATAPLAEIIRRHVAG